MPEAVQAGQVTDELGGQIIELATRVSRAARDQKRPDLAERLDQQLSRPRTTEASLVVVGAVSSGKSSLLNSLLETNALPTDADIATQAHVQLKYGPELLVRDLNSGDEIEVDDLHALWSNWTRERMPKPVDIALPDPLLEQGLVLVDTPGFGGLARMHDAVTKAAALTADAILMVVDASGPLSRTEAEFFREACEGVATAMLVMTKKDAFSSWLEVLDEDRDLLKRNVGDRPIDVLAVSSRLKEEADSRSGDPLADELQAESGFDELERLINDRVLRRARVLRRENLSQLARHAITELVAMNVVEKATGDPEAEAAKKAADEEKNGMSKQRQDWRREVQDADMELGRTLDRQCGRIARDMQLRWQSEVDNRPSIDTDAIVEELKEDFGAQAIELAGILQSEFASSTQRILRDLGLDPAMLAPPRAVEPLTALTLPPAPPISTSGARAEGRVTGLREAGVYTALGARLGMMAPGPALLITVVGGLVGFAASFFAKGERERRLREQATRQALRTYLSAVIGEVVSMEIKWELQRALRELRKHQDAELEELLERRKAELDEIINAYQAANRRSTEEQNERERQAKARKKELQDWQAELTQADDELRRTAEIVPAENSTTVVSS